MKSVAVIGGGIGGLTAAGALAAAGHRVTLFEAGPTLGGKAQVFASDGLTFDTGPTVMTMPETVERTFELLRARDLLPTLHTLELQTQYHYADGQTFSCWADLERAAESAEQLESGGAVALRRFYERAAHIHRAAGEPYLEAPYESMVGFMARAARRGLGALLTGLQLSTLDTLATRSFSSPHLRQFVNRFATYAGASPYEANAAFAMIAHLEHAHGVHHVQGGVGALVSALARAVTRLGVDIRLNSKTWWREHAPGELVVADERFDGVVVNADPMATQGRATEPRSMSGYVFFVEAKTLTVKPLDLPHHSIIFSSDYPREFRELAEGHVPSEPTIHVCHPGATDPSMRSNERGQHGLYVMVNVPALPGDVDETAEQFWAEQRLALKAWCLARMREQWPELRQAELRVLSDRTPLDLARLGAPGGSIYGFVPHGRLGPFRRPPMKARTPGVFFAGGGTHPGGGVPLVMLSGRFAAQLVERHFERGLR